MTGRLGDLASMVRSKNAGPFWLTIDIVLADAASFDRVACSPVVDPVVIAGIYDVAPGLVQVFRLPDLLAIKISFPRPVVQGSLADRDMHAGQQYVPLLGLAVDGPT